MMQDDKYRNFRCVLRAQPEFADHQGKLHFFSHAVDDHYYSMGVTLAAGHGLNWFRDTFAPDKSFAELLANVGKIAVELRDYCLRRT